MLLNHAGVLLYELLERAAAEALFEAALRLDPSLPYAPQNLAAGEDPQAQPAAACTGAFGARMRGARRHAAGRSPRWPGRRAA